MIVKQHLKPIALPAFKKMIKEVLFEKLQPTIVQEGTEVNLYYNHPTECKRMVARMGWFRTTHYAGQFALDLLEAMETVQKEWMV